MRIARRTLATTRSCARSPSWQPPSRPSKERHLETTAQGNAFVETTRAAWPCAALDRLKTVWDGPVAYPVAVGATAAGHGVALEAALARLPASRRRQLGFCRRAAHSARADAMASACWRRWSLLVAATAQRALTTALDDIGAAAFRADLASARHETQYTRLFRS